MNGPDLVEAPEVKGFQTFPIENLLDNSVTDFDLYVQIDGHFILYSGLGYRWLREELDGLMSNGYRDFIIKKEDLPKAGMYQELGKLPQIEKDLSPPERIRSIEQVGAKFVECLYQGEITPACVMKAESIADTMVNCVAEDTRCVQELSGLADYDYYTYYHSVRVASYAVAIAIALGMTDESMLRTLALGGIFHDIGKRTVPQEVLNKAGPLTNAEWDMMRAHPGKGLESIEDTILAHVPREIIVHHHEKLDGSGYPDKLDRGSIIYEVRIATLADVFDALTSSRSYQNKRTRYEALDLIKHRLLVKEIDKDAFSALVRCLAD